MAEKKDKKKDVEGNALTNIFTRKPKTVNLSKETLDKITPVLKSMQSSLKDQTASIRGLVELANLTLDSDKDAEERAIRNELLNQSIEKESARGLGIMAGKNTEGGAGDEKDGGGGFLKGLFGGMLLKGGALKLLTGGMVGMAAGLVALGVAIPAFLGALQIGDYGLEALNADFKFENIKKATIGFTDVISSVPPEGLLALGGLMGISAFSGDPLKMALGFSLLGAAIPGFFGGFAIGDAALGAGAKAGYLDLKFESIAAAVAGFGGVVREFPTDLTGAKMATVLGVGMAVGFFGKTKGAIDVGVGMSMIGAGIGGFFGGFALGEFAISKLGEIDYSGIKSAIGAFGDVVGEIDNKTEAAISVLLGAGGLVGKFLSFGSQGRVVSGMGMVGAGISAFLLGFSVPLALGSRVTIDGSGMKETLTNFSEGVSVLKVAHFEGLAAIMGLAGIMAVFRGKGALVGAMAGGMMGIIGAGIAAFITAFAGIGDLGGLIGIDGSGMGTVLKNFSEGINALSDINLQPGGLLGLGEGLGALGDGIITLIAATARADGWTFGSLFKGIFSDDEERKPFAQDIVDEVNTLMQVTEGNDGSNFKTTMTNISEGLSAFANSTASAFGSVLGRGDQIGKLTKDIDKLGKATDSLNNFTEALLKFSSIKISDKGLINIPDIISIAATEATTVASLGLTENLYNTADTIKKDEPVGVLRISQKSMSIAAAEEKYSIASIASSMINQDVKSAKQEKRAANIAVSAPGPVVTTINSPNQQRNTNIFIKTQGSLANGGRAGFN